MAEDLNATAIFAATHTGSTARLISSFRPRATIYGMTPFETTGRRLSLSWGVVPFSSKPFEHTDDLFNQVREVVVEQGLAEFGDVVIVTAGVPVGVSGTTNIIKALVV
jgi:pyruvate kinase